MTKISPGDTSGSSNRVISAPDQLIQLSVEAHLFHAPDRTAFADLRIDDHRETWPVRSQPFQLWLRSRYLESTGGAPSSAAFKSAVDLIEARAQFEGPERLVNVRVAGAEGKIFLDLGNEKWRCVEISAGGWKIVDDAAVRFVRPMGMRPIAEPVQGGSVESLRQFANLRTEADLVLVVAWLLAALRDRGPYPVLVLYGEQGSSKSTLTAMLRSLVDPNIAPLRALPRTERDLFITAASCHLLAFDNVSSLPDWLSDALCRVATGGGFATRRLFKDREEVIFDAVRPVILNGIDHIVKRPDLADRAIFVSLEPIAGERRRTEQELWQSFEEARPQILGALLSTVVHGLKRLSSTRLTSAPRMADFAQWATACEGSLWPAGALTEAFVLNRERTVDELLEANPLANAVRALMTFQTTWSGTASELIEVLRAADGANIGAAARLHSPRAVAEGLRRTAPVLREIGIEIGFARTGHLRNRTITLKRPGASS